MHTHFMHRREELTIIETGFKQVDIYMTAIMKFGETNRSVDAW